MSSQQSQSQSEQDEQKKIVETFQKLRQEQQEIVNEIATFEEERREHSRVLETLNELDPSRKCYKQLADSLVEYTVGDVIPLLQTNLANLTELVRTFNEKLVEKGKELNEHKTKHNIRFLTEKETEELRKAQMAQIQTQAAKPVSNAKKA
ncbi:hypothetical protein WR25_08308 [Diploscapter pachys]|uniref:Prefoldin subunit 2 n=1 Tax=Diploscapter pachys TaxID=2018661 RepID=A0A2A2LVH5_9BILA|nr:hypothetical protein WR25_08308 [Diploscapter pachys]